MCKGPAWFLGRLARKCCERAFDLGQDGAEQKVSRLSLAGSCFGQAAKTGHPPLDEAQQRTL